MGKKRWTVYCMLVQVTGSGGCHCVETDLYCYLDILSCNKIISSHETFVFIPEPLGYPDVQREMPSRNAFPTGGSIRRLA